MVKVRLYSVSHSAPGAGEWTALAPTAVPLGKYSMVPI